MALRLEARGLGLNTIDDSPGLQEELVNTRLDKAMGCLMDQGEQLGGTGLYWWPGPVLGSFA